jgi:PAS domain S-box-containing protein
MSIEVSGHSDQRFRALIERSSHAIALLTPEGIITYATPSTERVTGYAAGELVGMNGFALLHPEDLEDVRQQFTALLDQPGDFITIECRVRHPDGTWRWMEGTLTNLLDEPAVEAVMCTYRDITRRKGVHERLLQSEERYRALVEQASVGIVMTDLQGRFVEVNPAGCVLSGYNRDELLTRSIEDLVAGEDHAAVRAGVERLRAGETTCTQVHLHCQDGSLLPVELSTTLLSTGHLLRIIHDISARIQAEQARQQLLAREQAARLEAEAARARLYELFMHAPVAMAILRGPEHRYEFANLLSLSNKDRANRDRADPVGKTLREVLPELVEQGILAILDEVYTTGMPFVGTEFPLWLDRRGDGVLEEAYYNVVYQPSRTRQGDIDGIWVYSVEVTEQVLARRRVEELNRQLEAEKEASLQAQQEAEARASELEAVFEAMTEGVSVCDTRGEIRYTNAAYRSLLAVEEDADPSLLQLDNRFAWLATRDLEGRPLPKEQHPLLRVLRGERLSGMHRMDVICRNREGEDLILNVSGAPIRDATGQIVGGVVVFRDVTRRHKLEQQLQYSERKLRSLVESNIFGMMVSDSAGRIYEANDRFVQMVGYSKEELLSGAVTWQHLNLPEYQETTAQAIRAFLSTGAMLPYEKEYLRKDGSRVPILMAGAMVDQEREIALLVTLDISDRKEVEQRKQEFLSMVSHELRTPLTAILGLIEVALMQIDLRPRSFAPEAEGLLAQIEKVLQRASGQVEIETRLVEELLDVSRLEMHKFELSVQQENLVTIVQETVANQQQAARTRQIELTLPPDEVVPVIADAGRIGQVLNNYLTNALKYAPVEQVVSVRLEVETSMARVSVCDRGPGLTPEEQQHVWERFYQAAAPGHQGSDGGLGLGLAIARAIVEQHHGQVGAKSAPGQGSSFWFTLPLAASGKLRETESQGHRK